MCGIAGVYGPDPTEARRGVDAMCGRMERRGPDDLGIEVFSSEGFALSLGSRRLAIIDPSPAGHQPMTDAIRGTTIVFNGMIYNYRDLRERLIASGERFTSDCDTEVVLKAYGRYGPGFVHHLQGMFALAVWDPREQTLLLARDRVGIKPLYYFHQGDRLLFASEVRALLDTGLVPKSLSGDAVRSYLAYGAVGEPLTVIDGVLALPAGHTATLRGGRLKLERYWEPSWEEDVATTPAEAAAELRELLEDSVRRHLISDAPLGIFLSGGVDSSVLAALATRYVNHVRTISVVFEELQYAEGHYMSRVVERIGSDHVSVLLRPDQLLEWLDDAFEAMDQPTFDGINTYIVSRAAAGTGLKVALSGLGADELFDGYGYVRRAAALERIHSLPSRLTRLAGNLVELSGDRADKASYWLAGSAPRGSSYDLLRRVFLPTEVDRLVRASPQNGGPPPPRPVDASRDLYRQISVLDLENFMRNVLLRDTDSMSMSQSLEVRVPYLHQPLVEWALRQPAKVKGLRKALLIAAVRDLVPAEVLSRRKHGFVLPLREWMHRELGPEVGERLQQLPDLLAESLDAGAVRNVWLSFRGDGRRWLRPWSLYALSRWVDSLRSGAAVR